MSEINVAAQTAQTELINSFIEVAERLTPEQLAGAFKAIKEYTHDRLTKDAAIFAERGKALQDFIGQTIEGRK